MIGLITGFILAFVVSLLFYELALFLGVAIPPDLLGLICGVIGIVFIGITPC